MKFEVYFDVLVIKVRDSIGFLKKEQTKNAKTNYFFFKGNKTSVSNSIPCN